MAEKHIVNTEWKQNLCFETEINGHKILLDAPIEGGGQNLGPSPKKLLLSSLAACSGIDVISILEKMHIKPTSFYISVEGELMEDHPKYYKSMHVSYHLTGENISLEKVEKAVKLSEEKYCGVGAMYRLAIQVSSEIIIH